MTFHRERLSSSRTRHTQSYSGDTSVPIRRWRSISGGRSSRVSWRPTSVSSSSRSGLGHETGSPRELRTDGADVRRRSRRLTVLLVSTAEPTIVQVKGSDFWVGFGTGAIIAAMGLGVLIFLGVEDALGTSTGNLIGSLVVGVPILLFMLVQGGYQVRKSVRHLRSKLPALRLDADGIECAYGRVPWRSIESVGQAIDGEGGASLRFRFHPGETWSRRDAQYSTYLLNKKSAHGFEMDYWDKPRKVRRTLSRYYSGPIEV